jgi:hypothetical protein
MGAHIIIWGSLFEVKYVQQILEWVLESLIRDQKLELLSPALFHVVFHRLELYISSRFCCEFTVTFAPLYSLCNKVSLLSEHASVHAFAVMVTDFCPSRRVIINHLQLLCREAGEHVGKVDRLYLTVNAQHNNRRDSGGTREQVNNNQHPIFAYSWYSTVSLYMWPFLEKSGNRRF